MKMRSNDIIGGASAVNIFNYTFMQEYMATILGLGVGNYFPMHQAYIIEYQRLFILKGTSCIMTIKRSRKENVRRLHSVAFAYGLVPPFSVFL